MQPFRACFIVPLLLAVPLGATPVMAAEAQYDLSNPRGVLHGTLVLPDGLKGPVPVALIIAGSGPTDRDGSNAIGIPVKPYLQLANALAARGIASVRYDKRGIGASAVSAPLDNPATFTAYVNDVVAWVQHLRADSRFSRVVLVGHSEGSLLALLAAGKTPVDGVVSLEGAGRPAVDVIVEQLKAAGEPPDVADQAQAIGAAIRDNKTVPDVPAGLASIFPWYLRTYEQQWFSADPAVAAAAYKGPLLVLQGGADFQVSMTDAKLLAAAHPGAILHVFAMMTHVLMDATATDRAASLKTYTDTSLKIDPHMADTVSAFILQQPLP